MRLRSFLIEGRGKSLWFPDDKEFVIKTLKTKCKNSLKDHKDGYKIMRGVNNAGDMYLIDPKTSSRQSANTYNYYTVLLDGDKRWSKYPKRSNSIVCTTNTHKAMSYGSQYYVFPFDGSVIGVCPEDDIWQSFYSIKMDLGSFTSDLNDMVNILDFYGNAEKSYSDLMNLLDDISDDFQYIVDTYEDSPRGIPGGYSDLTIFKKWDKRISFKQWVMDSFDPKQNGFFATKRVKDIYSKGKKNKEVWTDGESMMIASYIYDDSISQEL